MNVSTAAGMYVLSFATIITVFATAIALAVFLVRIVFRGILRLFCAGGIPFKELGRSGRTQSCWDRCATASVGSSTVAMIRVFSVVMQPGAAGRRSMQAGAALEPGVSQQAFEHAAGIRVAGVIPARVTPISKIPLGGASFGD